MEAVPSIPYRLVFLGVAVINCLLSILLETFLLDHAVIRAKFRLWREHCCPSLKFEYHVIEEEMVSTPGWPPIGPDSAPIVYTRPQDLDIPDDFYKETDKMLAESGSLNTCNHSSSSLGYTTRTSSSESRYPSAASVTSSQLSSELQGQNTAVVYGLPDISEKKSESPDMCAETDVDSAGDGNKTERRRVDSGGHDIAADVVTDNFGYTLHDKSPL